MARTQDRTILRELAGRLAEIAALPVQEEKRRLWRLLNAKKPERPMVTIDQVCWNEMNVDDELTLRCADPESRAAEEHMRRVLFQWKRFPVDMVVDPWFPVPKAVTNTGFGLDADEETSVTDPTNSVVGHKFHNQFETDADLAKLKMPRISHDAKETARRLAWVNDMFGDLFPAKAMGYDPYLSIWDPISTWMSVEGALYALVDRPEFMHRLVGRMTDGYLGMLDQLEEQGLLCQPQSLIHCTGAFTDELPAPGYDPERPRTKDVWMFGLAQMFTTVSPAMFQEFEVDYASRICERFGLVYYGCCDPLDRKMNEVRRIPHVRKISMSPWVDQERGAAEIGRDYVFSRKPSPALLVDGFTPEKIRKDLGDTKRICDRNGCPLELIMKDISTVGHDPRRLFQWAAVAMEVAGS
jgi:hypothetical protein